MSCWSLTAVKSRDSGKSRLAGELPQERRRTLVDGMLAHVLDALRATPEVDHVAVVGPEYERFRQIVGFADQGGGLNGALTEAARQATARGATRLVIVHGDLPRVRPEEITALIEAAKGSGLAIAPDHRGTGTNALCLPLPLPVELRFGAESFARHLAGATASGFTPAIVRLPGLAFDLDEMEDLRSYEDTERLEQLEAASLMPAAEELTLAGHGRAVAYSRKVFIPLTQLCRDVCHTARLPRHRVRWQTLS